MRADLFAETTMKYAAKSRKSDLYMHLKTSIMTLELRPGADLDEAQLSEKFALSRTPLREVFRELAVPDMWSLGKIVGRASRKCPTQHCEISSWQRR